MFALPRALAPPITLEPDHNDVLASRDSSVVQIHAETCQEVVDSILMAYCITEDPLVCLPAVVNLDGFVLSFTREPVWLPEPQAVRAFLPPFRPAHPGFKASAPQALGIAVLGGSTYSYFRHQIHLASINALQVHDQAAAELERCFGRRYDVVEGYRVEDAEDVLVMSNAFESMVKSCMPSCSNSARLRTISSSKVVFGTCSSRPCRRRPNAHPDYRECPLGSGTTRR